MRRSEWVNAILETWNGEPCPGCGVGMKAFDVDEEGSVSAYCSRCNREFWVAWEALPSHFDPEPIGDDLPF